ncbi:hypothetical protein RNAN_1183 [Rheinheimera nanhaiensis E407-8]|uniref:Uncharacterized protein n=1 Tax=Rheinheimera nanhaiensis E407-8 TaxID=562729 RepID=I1DVY4_9GAMM|nr:hypothetical protein RNAN_1183 [Rheinheimera nanhaiensis E407-8]
MIYTPANLPLHQMFALAGTAMNNAAATQQHFMKFSSIVFSY